MPALQAMRIANIRLTSEGFKEYMKAFDNDTFNILIKKIKDLNLEIVKDPSLGNSFCIGHSYFCGQDNCSDEWMQSVVEYDILPMLEKYWFDETAKLQNMAYTERVQFCRCYLNGKGCIPPK